MSTAGAGRGSAPRPSALVIEDAPDICLLLCDTLRQAGIDATGAETGARGLELARSLSPDLVTLDLTLPDIDGIEVCRQLREISNAYVIVLTARDEEADRLVGLEVGADDYMVKPFSPRELRARVRAMFRRPRLTDPADGRAHGAVLRRGELVLDRESREVALAGRPVVLTRTEFDLLAALMARPHQVWERDTLARHVQHTDWPGDDHVIDVHIANLRHKLGDTGRESHWVRTVRGVGYRFGGESAATTGTGTATGAGTDTDTDTETQTGPGSAAEAAEGAEAAAGESTDRAVSSP